ncbi:MAG: hypothetical protein ACT4P4_28795 [Betaproteobacteria bacterium]
MAFAAAVQAAPFAMITDMKGDAFALEGGKQRKLALLSYIESPVEVKVEKATKLGITYFASGVQYSFDGPARVTLEAGAPKVLEGAAAQSKKVGPEKSIGGGGLSNDQWRRLQQATVVMRTVKSSFTVVGPDRTDLLAREPEFVWTPAADARRYRLVIFGPDNKIIHETTTEQTSLKAGAVKLEPGQKYRWKVDALGVSRPVSAIGTFTVAQDEVRERVTANRPASGSDAAARILYAATLAAEGHGHDACAEWKSLARELPDNAELKQQAERCGG